MEAEAETRKCEARTREIKVREDLSDIFEVLSHEESTLKCKLAGQDNCKFTLAFKYNSQRGWYNFERHAIRCHNVPPSRFYKSGEGVASEENCVKRRSKGSKKKKKDEAGDVVDEGRLSTKWNGLLSKEKRCFICKQLVIDDKQRDELFHSELRRLFPGCVGYTQLAVQLFAMFFMRNIIEFPARKCEGFLKQGRGRRLPDTWFNLCLPCRDQVKHVAVLNEQLVTLQNELQRYKGLIKSKLRESDTSNSTKLLSTIEKEIRKHIFAAGTGQTPLISSEDQSGEGEGNIVEEEQNLISSLIKIETDTNDNPCDFDDKTVAYSRSGRKYLRLSKSYKKKKNLDYDVGYLDTEMTETEQAIENSGVKFEHDQDQPISEFDEQCKSISLMEDTEDHDFEVSDVASDISNFSLSKSKRNCRKRKGIISTPVKAKASVKKLKASMKQAISRDVSAKQGPKVYMCQICPSKYKCRSSLKEHLQVHEISKNLNNKFDCDDCGFPCTTEIARSRHKNLRHSPEIRCSLCSYLCPTQRDYCKHLREHRVEAEREKVDGKYFCKLCKHPFYSYEVLCRHMRTSHYQDIGVVPSKCEQCSSIFSCQRQLQNHVRQTHNKQSRYFCEICGKGTLFMSKLRRHMLTHVKEKGCVCEICGADFIYKETLKTHIKKEHSEQSELEAGPALETQSKSNKNRTCKYCGLELASATLLGRHIKSHAELYANKCEICGKGYITSQSLRRHKEINHSERQVQCLFCGKRYLHGEYLRQHYKYCKAYRNSKCCSENGTVDGLKSSGAIEFRIETATNEPEYSQHQII